MVRWWQLKDLYIMFTLIWGGFSAILTFADFSDGLVQNHKAVTYPHTVFQHKLWESPGIFLPMGLLKAGESPRVCFSQRIGSVR